jgi:apolipoprotein N-acyltransferase
MAEFVRNGAEALFVVSNDGWWGNTIGHKLLFRYCRLRAIETRREVARSANTGVSGFINLRGEDSNKLTWQERGVTSENIRLNNRVTFYTQYGDYIARLSLYIAALCVLYLVAMWAKKRFYLDK